MELIIASIIKILWFVLGYQTCKLIRKHKDQEFMNELYSSILIKLSESETFNKSNDIIKEGNQE